MSEMIEATSSALHRALADDLRTLELPQALIDRALVPAPADDALEESVAALVERLPLTRQAAEHPDQGVDADTLIVATVRECLLLEEAADDVAQARVDRVRYGFVPALARLGMWELKRRLEDATFKAATPRRFAKLADRFEAFRAAREHYVSWTCTVLERELAADRVEAVVTTDFCSVDGASRRLKAFELGESFSRARVTEFYDLVVVASTEAECWRALAAAHRAGTPVPRTLEDLLSTPRANGFSGILTQVSIAPPHDPADSLVARIVIQTPLMSRVARYGIACRECYARLRGERAGEDAPAFVQELLASARSGSVDQDCAPEPRVFTVVAVGGRERRKTLFTFEEGATVLDLAYRIHREIGADASHARVNGRRVELGHLLAHNDRVVIVRDPDRRRREEDLALVTTRKARRLLRQDLNRDGFTRGRYLIRQYLELTRGLMLEDAGEVDEAAEDAAAHVEELEDVSAEGLYRFVGADDRRRGPVGAKVAEALARRRAASSPLANSPVAEWLPALVPGVEARTSRLKLCDVCAPGPAHTIVGLDRSQRVTVHHRQCVHVQGRSTIALEWRRVERPVRSVVTLYCEDRPLLVHSVCQRISRRGSGLEEIHATADEFGRARVAVHVYSHSAIALGDLLEDLRSVRSVRSVELTSTSLPERDRQRLARSEWGTVRRELERQQEAVGALLIEPRRATDRRSHEIVLPYNEQKPAFWADTFYGRRRESEKLIGRMSGRGQAYVLITGPRRIGKTSLAMRFADRLPSPQRPHVLRADLRGDRGSSAIDVLRRLAAALHPLDRSVPIDQGDPRATIAALVTRSEKPVVLILDEFAAVLESFRDGRLGDELFSWIRSMMDGETAASEDLNMVMVSPPEGVELLYAPGVSRYLDRLVSLRLAPLDPDGAREMIRRPLAEEGIRVRTDAADALVTMTAGHPYYLILFMREIVDLLNERRTKWEVTLEDVTRCTRAVIQHRYCFTGAVNEPGGGLAQHASLRAVARLQPRPDATVPLREIRRRTGMGSSLVDEALARLVAYDVLERHVIAGHEPSYRFSIPLVRSWVRVQGDGDLAARPAVGSRGRR